MIIAAKAVHPKKQVSQLQGLLKVHRPIPPFVAIPTTAGAGSETTVAAVITDSATHRKAAINDSFLIPKYAVLDPELTVDLPPHTTATTGMDALAHAVEAYTNHTYCTKLENRMAKEAVRLGTKIALIATVETTLGPSQRLIEKEGAKVGKKMECTQYLQNPAWDALQAGHPEEHNRILMESIRELDKMGYDAIVMAQVSMRALLPALTVW